METAKCEVTCIDSCIASYNPQSPCIFILGYAVLKRGNCSSKLNSISNDRNLSISADVSTSQHHLWKNAKCAAAVCNDFLGLHIVYTLH